MSHATATLERPTAHRHAPPAAPAPPRPAQQAPIIAPPNRAVEALRRATEQAHRMPLPPGTLQNPALETALEEAYERAPAHAVAAQQGKRGGPDRESWLVQLGWL